MSKGSRAPACPGCGAKFSHDLSNMRCKACGLPDEAVELGPKAVARWMKNSPLRKERGSSTRNKRVNKHGRRGVARAAR